jgi:hypothetical protein
MKELDLLERTISELDIPITAFLRTDLLSEYSESQDVARRLAKDFHCHSHTHKVVNFDSDYEISTSAKTFEEHFGYKSLGYRAPYGVLYDSDIEIIHKNGFKFSSSIFPSYRPGKFNNLRMPTKPFVYDNGIIEFPFAVVPLIRYVISLSYMKLIGANLNKLLYSIFGLPNVLVFCSHLHDFILNEESFRQLSLGSRLAWGINRHSGIYCFTEIVRVLKRNNYRFITMTELYQRITSEHL